MPKSAVWAGESIDRFIPPQLRNTFYKNSNAQSKYARNNGIGAYDMPTNGLALYLPLWALNNGGTNSIQSVDAFRHACTVYGSTWGVKGRTMDGDDYIYKSVANFQSADFAGTILVWFKTSSAADTWLLSSCDEGTDTYVFGFGIRGAPTRVLAVYQRNNDTADEIKGGTGVIDGIWHLGALVSSGTAYSIYLDGVVETLTTVGGANTGDWFADTTLRDNFAIGALVRTSIVNYLTGVIGEVWVYNRAFSAGEIMNNYLARRWRY